MLDPELNEEKICKVQPVDVEDNASFIVDISKLRSMKDIYFDDMGSWNCTGIYKSWIDVDFTGYVTIHGKAKPSPADASFYYIAKKYFSHKTSTDLKKNLLVRTYVYTELFEYISMKFGISTLMCAYTVISALVVKHILFLSTLFHASTPLNTAKLSMSRLHSSFNTWYINDVTYCSVAPI